MRQASPSRTQTWRLVGVVPSSNSKGDGSSHRKPRHGSALLEDARRELEDREEEENRLLDRDEPDRLELLWS